jgi:DNA-binding NarL/FixJ family response regulator
MPQGPDIPPLTSVLLIDGSASQRTYWADELKRCSSDYQIIEASDGESGLDLYRSRRIDCVVLKLSLPDGQSGFETLVKLVPVASRPQIAVVVLTLMTYRGLWEVAKQNKAYACLAKKFTLRELEAVAVKEGWEVVERFIDRGISAFCGRSSRTLVIL